jgi:biotin operon repressor
MDPIKEAFARIKEDISTLRNEILTLKQQISLQNNQTIPTQNPTHPPQQTDTQTHIPTLPQEAGGFYQQNMDTSTGNKGVPTDKQTNRQTLQQTDKTPNSSYNSRDFDEFQQARNALDSLDSLKKSLRLKFKRLTPQEMLVFSTLYSLEEQGFDEITYKMISNNLNLSESSIRDYVNKLSKKGIPIVKIRQNNKQIVLSISPNLKEVASLSTINQLRGI